MSGYDIWTIRLELSLLSLSENTIAGNFDHFIEVELTMTVTVNGLCCSAPPIVSTASLLLQCREKDNTIYRSLIVECCVFGQP